MEMLDKHVSKAEQCIEYGKLDDAKVHLTIARILREGMEARFEYEQESLNNLAQSL